MSWPDRARLSDHSSATSQACGQADQSHEVRHAARHRHHPVDTTVASWSSYSPVRRRPAAVAAIVSKATNVASR